MHRPKRIGIHLNDLILPQGPSAYATDIKRHLLQLPMKKAFQQVLKPKELELKSTGGSWTWKLPDRYPTLTMGWTGDFVAQSRREGNPGIAKAFLVLLQAQVPAKGWAWLRKASISSSMVPHVGALNGKHCWAKTMHDHAVCEHGPAWGATQPVPRGGHIVPSVLGATGEPLPSMQTKMMQPMLSPC